MDKNRVLPLLWLPLIVLSLTACVRSASTPDPRPAPGLDDPAPTPGLAPGPIPFPLAPASTWIYEYSAYAEDQQATWIVTETILSVQESDGLLIAEVERLAQIEQGEFNKTLPSAPESGIFWYILRDGQLYRQTVALSPGDLTKNTRLELVSPLESVPCWPVVDVGNPGPLNRGDSGCRYVSAFLPVYETPAGRFEDCLELVTSYLSGGILTVFCPNIGFVAETYRHSGTPFGYEFVLTGYSLQSP